MLTKNNPWLLDCCVYKIGSLKPTITWIIVNLYHSFFAEYTPKNIFPVSRYYYMRFGFKLRRFPKWDEVDPTILRKLLRVRLWSSGTSYDYLLCNIGALSRQFFLIVPVHFVWQTLLFLTKTLMTSLASDRKIHMLNNDGVSNIKYMCTFQSLLPNGL